MEQQIIANKYKIINKISSGVFGSVYKAENIRTKEIVAIKCEEKSETVKSLKNEAKIYQYLGKLDGFPQLKTYGTIGCINFLVMDYLGQSLNNIVKPVQLKTLLVIGIQMIKRIRTLHEKSLLHRDIKPSNFLFGHTYNSKIYLVDFGFSKRFNYDGKHIEEGIIKNIIGSPNFVSLNIHNKIEPSRRDDLESCIYILLLLFYGELNWFNETNMSEIKLLKTRLLDTNIPLFIKKMLYYVRCLKFDECPDYDYIIDLMIKELNK